MTGRPEGLKPERLPGDTTLVTSVPAAAAVETSGRPTLLAAVIPFPRRPAPAQAPEWDGPDPDPAA